MGQIHLPDMTAPLLRAWRGSCPPDVRTPTGSACERRKVDSCGLPFSVVPFLCFGEFDRWVVFSCLDGICPQNVQDVFLKVPHGIFGAQIVIVQHLQTLGEIPPRAAVQP